MTDPFRPFIEWLAWLDTPEGVAWRRANDGDGTEYDRVCLIPTPPTRAVFTVADLRALVRAGADRGTP
jgi:hypothetical protein